MPASTKRSSFQSSLRSQVMVLGVSLLLSLLAGEVFLRIWRGVRDQERLKNPEQTAHAFEAPGEFYGKYGLDPEIRYDEYIGFLPRPGVNRSFYQTNQNSFREREDVLAPKPPGEKRIFLTGGSAAWGAGVRQEVTFAYRINERFRAEAERSDKPRVRCINAACSFFLSTQERSLLVNRIIDLEPDLIVMFSGWNDAYVGYSGGNVLEGIDPHGFRKIIEGRWSRTAILEPPVYVDYPVKLHYALDRVLYQWHWRNRSEFQEALRKRSVPPEIVAQRMIRNIEIVWDQARRKNSKLLFVLQPEIFSTRKPLTPEEEKIRGNLDKFNNEWPQYVASVYAEYRKAIPTAAKEEGFTFLDGDQYPLLTKDSFFLDGVHFGDRGHRLIAESLGKTIQSLIGEKK